MIPKDLKTGHICLHKSGELSMVVKDTCEDYANEVGGNLIFSSNSRIGLKDFNDDFTCRDNTTPRQQSLAIIKVFSPINICNAVKIFEKLKCQVYMSQWKLVWERKKIEKMTLKQVCKELGKTIKIIK
jgi:hypothetical protein